MHQFQSFMCATLALLMMIFFSINPAIAQEYQNKKPIITQHEPKSRLSEAEKPSEKRSQKTLLWSILGVVVLIGGIAAVAGGTSGGGGDDSNGGSSTGDYNFSW